MNTDWRSGFADSDPYSLHPIEFTLSQRKAEFYRCLTHALEFFGASPRAIIVDNLKTAVINGSAAPPVFILSSWPCAATTARSPSPVNGEIPSLKESSRRGVRYVKRNALAGRSEELVRFEDYIAFAARWRDEIANVRIHETTRERPVDRFQKERSLLRALLTIPFDTDEIVPAVVSPHAQVEFDANCYSARCTCAPDGHDSRRPG